MSRESRVLAGALLIVIPTVMFGGAALLAHLVGGMPGYTDNPLRQDLWRAGHAHAGVFLILSLVMLRYVDEAALSPGWAWVARLGAPIAAVFDPGRLLPFSTLAGGDRSQCTRRGKPGGGCAHSGCRADPDGPGREAGLKPGATDAGFYSSGMCRIPRIAQIRRIGDSSIRDYRFGTA